MFGPDPTPNPRPLYGSAHPLLETCVGFDISIVLIFPPRQPMFGFRFSQYNEWCCEVPCHLQVGTGVLTLDRATTGLTDPGGPGEENHDPLPYLSCWTNWSPMGQKGSSSATSSLPVGHIITMSLLHGPNPTATRPSPGCPRHQTWGFRLSGTNTNS